jgi:dihydrofolate reductase
VAERKVVALEHLSLDGVIQGPGKKEEDPSGGFAQGGWTGLISDPSLGPLFDKQLHQRFDLLLGRRTYDIWGSSQVVQELVRHDLIDEFWLVIYPIVVGSGKRLFAGSSIALAYRVTESTTTPRGVLVVRYQRSKSLN